MAKIIDRQPHVVYEFEDLNGTPIEGEFNRDILTPGRITDRTAYKIDKILDKRVRRGIREYLVHWRGSRLDYHSWVPVASVKDVSEIMALQANFRSLYSATPRETTTNRIRTPISR